MIRNLITFITTALLVFCVSMSAFAARMQDSDRFSSCAATISATGTYCVTDLRDQPGKAYSLQAFQSFDASTTYTVKLQGSLDGAVYTDILSRTNAIPDLTTSTTSVAPYRFLQLNATALAANKTVNARFLSIQ